MSIDDKHGPNLYARFLKGLLAAPLAKVVQRRPVRSNSGQPMDPDSTPSNHTSPDTSHSLSPPPTTAALSFDRFAPPLGAGVDPFMPLATGPADGDGLGLDTSAPDFFPPSLPYNQDPMQGIQSLTTGWPDGKRFSPHPCMQETKYPADFSWLQNPDYMRTESMYTTSY